jgi:hypothetical protein
MSVEKKQKKDPERPNTELIMFRPGIGLGGGFGRYLYDYLTPLERIVLYKAVKQLEHKHDEEFEKRMAMLSIMIKMTTEHKFTQRDAKWIRTLPGEFANYINAVASSTRILVWDTVGVEMLLESWATMMDQGLDAQPGQQRKHVAVTNIGCAIPLATAT